MKIIDKAYENYPSKVPTAVPLTRYQVYTIQRHRIDHLYDLDTDVGRFNAFIWFIQHYGKHRKPLLAPISKEQVRWMLSPVDAQITNFYLPKITNFFWQKELMTNSCLDPYTKKEDYLTVAYWWCCEMAPSLGIEHIFCSDEMVNALAEGSVVYSGAVPASELLVKRLEKQQSLLQAASSEAGRIAIYIHILFENDGIYQSVFFNDKIFNRLKQTASTRPYENWLRFDAEKLSTKLAERLAIAEKYRKLHKEIRKGNIDVHSPSQGSSWIDPSILKPSRNEVANIQKLEGNNVTGGPSIRLVGPLNSQSGLGQATRMTASSLLSAGICPIGLDYYQDNPAIRRRLFDSGKIIRADKAINILHLNAESIPIAPMYLDKNLFENAYNIGYFFWELPQVPAVHRLAIEMLDEIWVSSKYNQDTYSGLTDRPVVKIGMAVETLPSNLIEKSQIRRQYGIPEASFVFLTTFDSYSFLKRKNPADTIKAFLGAFANTDDNVCLVIKTHNFAAALGEVRAQSLVREIYDLVKNESRIVVIDETIAYHTLISLKSAADCYVTLHRSEGWGFGAIEAMQLGLPVISTAFSGNLEFCTAETALNVNYEKRYLDRDDYIFVTPGDFWADADVGQASAFMRRVFEEPEIYKKVGLTAKIFVESNFSPPVIGKNMKQRLDEISRIIY